MQQLLEIQKQLLKYKKKGKANYWKYLTLDDLLDKLLPICNDLDLLVYHTMEDNKVVTTISHWQDKIQSSFPITDFSNPQKIWSAITYAKRYNLWQIFNIVTDDDDDGHKASQKPTFWQKELEALKSKIEEYKTKYPTAESLITMLQKTYIIDPLLIKSLYA